MKKILILTIAVYALIILSGDVKAVDMVQRLKGKILLQVQANGEAWYINPANEQRYFMGRPEDAFSLMRNLGVGISNSNIQRIPVADANLDGKDSDGDGLSDMIEDAFGTDKNKQDTDNDGFNDKDEVLRGFSPLEAQKKYALDTVFADKNKGKIFLQVESKGEAWYVNSVDGKRYYLGRPADAFSVMRKLGLGITNKDLQSIPEFGKNGLPVIEKEIDLSGFNYDLPDMSFSNPVMGETGLDALGLGADMSADIIPDVSGDYSVEVPEYSL